MSESKTMRYSAHRGTGQWCVFDNKTRKRVGPWRDMLEAAVEAAKLNSAELKKSA